MSFLSWFSGKYLQPEPASVGRDKLVLTQPQRFASKDDSVEVERKTRRQVCRGQLHEVIREAMIQTGVLSTSYKIKVIALNPRSNGFLVMIDLTYVADDTLPQSGEMEALIVQGAGIRHSILISAVYWRINEVAALSQRPPACPATTLAPSTQSARKREFFHEPIQADELAAFQRALLTASTKDSTAALEQDLKASSPWRTSAHPRDLEEIELPESISCRALSKTLYGNLH